MEHDLSANQNHKQQQQELPKYRIREFFTEDWSVAGIKYVFNDGISILRRIFWLLLVLAGVTLMVFQIKDRITYFLGHPTRVDVYIDYSNQLTFPTVTICNENIIDGERPDYNYMLPIGLKDMMNAIYPVWPEISVQPNFTVMKNLTKEMNKHNYTWEDFWKVLSPFSSKRHIEMCIYDGILCDKNNFTLVPTTLGYCLQFNGAGFNYSSNRPGLTSGLSIVVNIRAHEYLYVTSVAAGVRVHLGDKKGFPHVNKFGFHASAGFTTSAAVKLKSVTRMAAPFGNGNCSKDINYNYNECIEKCRQDRVIAACGCRYFYYKALSKGPEIKSCSPKEMYECGEPELSEYPMNNNTATLCGCIPQCTSESFSYSISQAMMSDFAVKAAAVAQINKLCTNVSNCNTSIKAMEKTIKHDWVQVNIYYEDMLKESIITKEAYPRLQLLCDIGGAMGLILGSTVLSFVEIFDFAIITFLQKLFRKNKAKLVSQK